MASAAARLWAHGGLAEVSRRAGRAVLAMRPRPGGAPFLVWQMAQPRAGPGIVFGGGGRAGK